MSPRVEIEHIEFDSWEAQDLVTEWYAKVWVDEDLIHVSMPFSTALDAISAARAWCESHYAAGTAA